MPTSFPEIEPTDRSFNAPRWPTSSDTTKSGAITRRLWGSRPNSGQLSLKFQNTTDANAAAILAAYDNAKGSVDTLTLPAILFNGANANLKAWLDGSAHGAGLLWCFTEGAPPQVESIAPGRSTVTVNLTAELRTPSLPVAPANGVGVWTLETTHSSPSSAFTRYYVIEIFEPFYNGSGSLIERRIVQDNRSVTAGDVLNWTPNTDVDTFFSFSSRSVNKKEGISYWDPSNCPRGAGTNAGYGYAATYIDGVRDTVVTGLGEDTLYVNCDFDNASESFVLNYIGSGVIRDWWSVSALPGTISGGVVNAGGPIPEPDLPGPS